MTLWLILSVIFLDQKWKDIIIVSCGIFPNNIRNFLLSEK